jgi:hypothetical protein
VRETILVVALVFVGGLLVLALLGFGIFGALLHPPGQ